ncbi:hypothetical protein HK100_004046, partial [Physocladia obscura]
MGEDMNIQNHHSKAVEVTHSMRYVEAMNQTNQANQSMMDATPTNPVERGWMNRNANAIPFNFATLNAEAAPDWLGWLPGMSAHNLNQGPDLDLGLMPLGFMGVPAPSHVLSDATCFVIPTPYPPVPAPLKSMPTACHNDDAGHNAALKRLRNTEAARKSRVRRAAKINSFKLKVDTLEKEKLSLTKRIAVLENNTMSFAQRENDLKRRIATLEHQLMESHRTLVE